MDAKRIATEITESLLASLRIAIEQGTLTADNLAAIARAAGNNAAQRIVLLAEDDDSTCADS